MQQREVRPFSGECPVCGERMVVTSLACPVCETSVQGSFSLTADMSAAPQSTGRGSASLLTRLARLDSTQLEFVEAFLRCRGVIKNVEDMLGISYPTVRARLTSILDALGYGAEQELPVAERRTRRREILAELRDGLISTEEAHRLLAREHLTSDDDDGS